MPSKSLQALSKSELYERAQKADIAGRSEMGKDELVTALSKPRTASKSNGSKKSKGSKRVGSKSDPPTTSRRSIWSGAITFGLITIPVGLYTATEDRDISFHHR